MSTDRYRDKLKALNGEPITWRLQPDDRLVGDFERRFKMRLPTHYLTLRARRKLPAKPRGYENFYRVAASFDEFFQSCQPPADDAPAAPQPAAPARWSLVDVDMELAVVQSWDKLYEAILNVPQD